VSKQNIGRLKSNTNQKLPNGEYSKNCENFFKNIVVFCPLTSEKVLKNTIFGEKCLFYSSNVFMCNYLTPMQYTIGKNSLHGRE